jgi:hypothetical protein
MQGRCGKKQYSTGLPDLATAVQSGTGGEANKRKAH